MTRSDKRGLVADGGAPKCPGCQVPLFFQSDRHGRTFAQCACGYRAYVERRTGKREELVAAVAS